MKLFCVDSASVSGACALVEDGKVLAEGFVHNGLTHSQTLLPMITDTLSRAGVAPSEIDCFAVTRGPGSFTGLRIGMATVKGMAAAFDTPCVGVSTLHALALGAPQFDGVVCAVMDARRDQVYYALFEGGERLCADAADAADAVLLKLQEIGKPVLLVGDGAELCFNKWKDSLDAVLSDESCRFLHGGAIAAAAESGIYKSVGGEALQPVYLRLPQAERELKAKRGNEKC